MDSSINTEEESMVWWSPATSRRRRQAVIVLTDVRRMRTACYSVTLTRVALGRWWTASWPVRSVTAASTERPSFMHTTELIIAGRAGGHRTYRDRQTTRQSFDRIYRRVAVCWASPCTHPYILIISSHSNSPSTAAICMRGAPYRQWRHQRS